MSVQLQRAFTTAFKESVVLRPHAGERVASVVGELGVRDMTHIARSLAL
jgi:hypothetical protein